MKYSEFLDQVAGDFTEGARRVAALPLAERLAWKIVQDFLYDRKGFDDWWDGIDDEVRDELFDELVTFIGYELA